MKVIRRKGYSNGDAPLTLKEALKQPCKHRDMDLVRQPMENYSSTIGGKNGIPLSF